MGKLVAPKKKIDEGDDEMAHIDQESRKVVHFIKSTAGHDFMVDKVLKPD